MGMNFGGVIINFFKFFIFLWLSVNFFKMAAITCANSRRAADWVHLSMLCVVWEKGHCNDLYDHWVTWWEGIAVEGSPNSKACLLYCALTRMFLSNAPSSFATGIVLQRFAIIGQRRHTRGGQSLLMWRQWFCFFRMFGIVFLPAQSGRCCHGDSGSSWLRSCRPSERRQMENRHWTANPSLLISASHRKAQDLQKNKQKTKNPRHTHTQNTKHTSPCTHTDTNPGILRLHQTSPRFLLFIPPPVPFSSAPTPPFLHQHSHLPSHPADTHSGSSETRLCCVGPGRKW